MKAFLFGVLVGVSLLASVLCARNVYFDYQMTKARISYIEGYLQMLDKVLRGAAVEAPQEDPAFTGRGPVKA